jgi:hypothetical protein
MDLQSMGEVIATRRLFLLDDPDREVLVQLGKLQKTAGEDDYSCSAQIIGIGDERVRRVFGFDAFQAIQLTMRFIGTRLVALNEENGGRLRWEGDEHGGFGFFPGS